MIMVVWLFGVVVLFEEYPSQQCNVIITQLLRNMYVIWILEWKLFLHTFPYVNAT